VAVSLRISGSIASMPMSGKSKAFFDTNILLYLVSGNTAKAQCAEDLVSEGGVISVQVLNEFASVAARKLHMPISEIREFLEPIRMICSTASITPETHERGLELAERYGFSIYDAMIVASALLAGCDILYSEDFHDEQRIEDLVITSPFSAR
jgi:predicted nucleic acid-binding protein